MLDFFKNWRDQERHAAETATETYTRLIHKLADAGKLTDADGGKLRSAADSLGKSYEPAEADADVIRRAAELKAVAGRIAEAEAANRDTSMASREFAEATQRIVREREAQQAELRWTSVQAARELDAARSADRELADLRSQHGHLIGLDDPNAEHRDYFATAIRTASGERPPADLRVNTGAVLGGREVVLSDRDFEAEVARRREYVDACRASMDRQYREALEGWNAFVGTLSALEKENVGRWGREPQPKPSPTWDTLRRRFGRSTPPVDEVVKLVAGSYPPAPKRGDFVRQPAVNLTNIAQQRQHQEMF